MAGRGPERAVAGQVPAAAAALRWPQRRPIRTRSETMREPPTLYVCHGDEGGPRIHPCRRVQEALRAKGVEYTKVVAAHGSPIPFLRKGSRDELRAVTGDEKLPALKLADGTVIRPSKKILAWIDAQ
jgi:hypothetical protein